MNRTTTAGFSGMPSNPIGRGFRRGGRGGKVSATTTSLGSSAGRGAPPHRRFSKPNHQNQQEQQHRPKLQISRKPISVFVSDFDSFREHCQHAARYKVHRPNCSCPNVKNLLSNRLIVSAPVAEQNNQGVHGNVNSFSEDVLDEWTSDKLRDGLLVLPQTKSISSVYFCLHTTAKTFDCDPEEAERKLRTELFPDRNSDRVAKSFEVSCAACLLYDEPNGFACVSSTSQESVDRVRDKARRLADAKLDRKHADHAHFVATVPLDALAKLHRSKTRHQIQSAQDELEQHLVNQGVPLQPDANEIKLQHHLSSLLWLTKDLQTNGSRTQPTNCCWYWLVIVFDNTNQTQHPHWSLDLPGGKRHLGESSLEAAIRETEEETSLIWDAQWIREERRGRRPSDSVNRYYMLSPLDDDTRDAST